MQKKEQELGYFDIINKLKNYDEYLHQVNNAILYLDEHSQLLDKQNKIIFAVDFSELVAYCFPTSKIPNISSGPGEKEENIRLRERIALASLFTDYGTLLLLPPHKIELANFLKTVYTRFHLLSSQYQNEIINLRNLILQDEEVVQILHNKNQISDIEKLPESLRMKLISVAQKYFTKIKALETYSAITGVDKLQSLLNNKKVLFIDDLYSSVEIEDESLVRETRPWFLEFLSQRSRDEQEYANYLDAMACVYLSKINQYLIGSHRAELVVFLSRSAKMLDIIDTFMDLSFNNRRISITRNLFFILFNDLCNPCSDVKRGDAIAQLKNDFAYLLKNCEGLYSKDMSLLNIIVFREIDKRIQDIYAILNDKINIELCQSEPGSVQWTSDSDRDSAQLTQQLLSILANIFETDDKIKNYIDKLLKQLSNRLIGFSDQLRNGVKSAKYLQPSHIEEIASMESKRGCIFLVGLKGEMPTRIKFKNPDVIKLAKTIFQKEAGYSSPKSILQHITEIDSRNRLKPSAEYAILKSYLEACAGHWSSAQQALLGLSVRTKEAKLEYLYYKTFICRKNEDTINGLKSCIEALSLNKKDPRILREFGVLIWQCYQHSQTDLLQGDDLLSKLDTSRENAIKLIKEALKYSNYDDELTLQCYNSLAYFYAESKEEPDLKIAESYYKLIEAKQMDRAKHNPRFLDTLAYINYKLALTEHNNPVHKKRLLTDALDAVNKAIESGGLIQKELNTVLKHRFDIQDALQQLP